MNWTQDSFTLQENCIVRLDCAEVAAAYLRDFEELWKRPQHLDKSGRFDSEWSDATFGGQPVRVRPFFCPGRGPELAALIGSRIACARERILICSPVLTSGPILGALSDVVGRGKVPVTGVVDRTQMQDVLRQWGGLPKASWKPARVPFRRVQGRLRRQAQHPVGPGDRARLPAREARRLRRLGLRRLLQPLARGRGERRERARDRRQGGRRSRWPRRSASSPGATRPGPATRGKTLAPSPPAPLGPLTRQLDRGRPQLAAELLEHCAAQLRHVHRQRQRVLAQPGEQG